MDYVAEPLLQSAPRPNTMKEFETDFSHELDAGWDITDTDAISVSNKLAGSGVAKETEDLDSGWDLDEVSLARSTATKPSLLPAEREDSKSANPTAVATQGLSKKARRELERQKQIHAANRKTQAKKLRKQERRAKLRPIAEPYSPTTSVAALPVIAPPARNKRSNSHRRDQPKRESELKPESSSSRNRPLASHSVTFVSSESQAPRSESPLPAEEKAPTISGRRWIVGIAVLMLLTLAFVWFHFRAR